MAEASVDCWSCRLTSGLGVIGGGIYVASHARKQSMVGMVILGGISVGLCGLGLCRIFQLPPFATKSKNVESLKNPNDESAAAKN